MINQYCCFYPRGGLLPEKSKGMEQTTAGTVTNHGKIITIFGAKGKAGIELVRLLSQSGIYSRAVTRSLQDTPQLPFVNWLSGDLSDKESIPNLVAGTDYLFLNTAFHPKMAEMQVNAIAAARAAKVSYIIKLSYGLISNEVLQQVASATHQQHLQVEQYLINSGIRYTILRPSGFMQNWLTEVASTIQTAGKIYEAVGDGAMPYIDTRDIAAVVAQLLQDGPEKHHGHVYELTGREAINFYRVAAAISQATGKAVGYVAETATETHARLTKKGYPEWAVNMLLKFAESQRAGKETRTTTTVEAITGRAPFSVEDFAVHYQACFK